MTMNRRAFIGRVAVGGAAIAITDVGLAAGEATVAESAPSGAGLDVGKVREEYHRISAAEYQDRVLGAFLGKIVGTMFGDPFEGEPKNVIDRLDRLLGDDQFAPVDDDYYYEMIATYGFERHGIGMTVEQLGELWLEYQCGVWGSSREARLLMEKGIKPPHTGEPRYNRFFNTIGAQFSSGLYGMIAPGMTNLAGDKARHFTHINGYAEGCDGAVFVAACTSEAFVESDPEKVVRRAVQLISSKSNYRKAIDLILAGYSQNRDWQELASESENLWRPDYPQINNSVANGALCALALLYGKGDWLNSVNIITAAGDFTDADCNCDVVSSVVATMRGSKTLPPAIVQQLHDRIYGTGLGPVKFNHVIDERISAFAVRISAVGRKLLLANGGREENGYLLIPKQPIREQPLEWFDINDYARLWNADWKMVNGSRGGQVGSTYLEHETNTLVTYPRDSRPCRLERHLQVPSGESTLRLRVGSIPNEPWSLQIRVNDDRVVNQIIASDAPGTDAQYQDVQVDLTKYAGQRVTLRLYQFLTIKIGQVAKGKVLGSAYWRSVDIHAA